MRGFALTLLVLGSAGECWGTNNAAQAQQKTRCKYATNTRGLHEKLCSPYLCLPKIRSGHIGDGDRQG